MVEDILVFQIIDGKRTLIDILTAPLKFYYRTEEDGEEKKIQKRITPNQLAREKYGIDGSMLTQCLYGRREGASVKGYEGLLDFTFRHAYETYLESIGEDFPEKHEPIVQKKPRKRRRQPEYSLPPELKNRLRREFRRMQADGKRG